MLPGPHRMRESRIRCGCLPRGCGGFAGDCAGAARLRLAEGVRLLRPEEQVFTAMLDGWRNQQPARNLARSTVEGRKNTVRAFAACVSAYQWLWTLRSGQTLPELLPGGARRPPPITSGGAPAGSPGT